MPEPFILKDCTLAVCATGESANSIKELRDTLEKIHPGSIYYHFWGERLRPSFVHPEYHNDFARWAHFSLNDNVLSERLGIVDPTEFSDNEELRKVLIEIIEERLDEIEYIFWSKKGSRFHFLRSIIIVFDTTLSVSHPSELKGIIPALPPTALYYHFIDARNRTQERTDDFSVWLKSFNGEFEELISKVQHIDPYFLTLTEVRQKLSEILNEQFS